jgi:hypothetical protein
LMDAHFDEKWNDHAAAWSDRRAIERARERESERPTSREKL